MDRISLGQLEVSRQGLGCMGMSEWYGAGDWESSIATIHRALELGVTFIDTADVYGSGHNEVLVGRAIHDRRDGVQVATKFGIDRSRGQRASWKIRGEAGYVKRSCESSLLRLGVDSIDLYYLHRPPQTAEIEETVGAMAELGIGLVPCSPLGRGFLTGTVDVTTLDDKDFRGGNPRFQGEAREANQAI